MKEIRVQSEGDLPRVAEEIIGALRGRKLIAFWGGMGAGKTTLIRYICQELGSEDAVSSPTFALVNEYADGLDHPIYHFDFYRIERLEEAFDFGYEEYFDSGSLCLVEWPEKILPLLPDEGVMHVRIETMSPQARLITIDTPMPDL